MNAPPELRSSTHAGRMVFVLVPDGSGLRGHTAATRADLAARLAALLGLPYGGEYQPRQGGRGAERAYYVPTDTLDGDRARQLGIAGELDLFGGVVPYPFVATKTISHPVVDPGARVPEGWSHEVASWIGDAVLPGFSAFSPQDAREAGYRLLRDGPVRLKLASGAGGNGQSTATDADALEAVIAALDPGDVHRHGVVLEQDLAEPVTYSVGRVRIGDWELAYNGTQHDITDHRGIQVYGGSDLWVVRGGFDALLQQPLPSGHRRAVEYAMRYDGAVGRAWPGFFASRRNYDVVAGTGGDGRPRCGVLEQSWRIGGASPAELAALAAFRADPALERVHAWCREIYSDAPPPAGAEVHYRGVDAEAGMLCKLCAAYDWLAAEPNVDPDAIAVVGISYGGYLASILAGCRKVHWLALRSPALYPDEGWELPKRQLHEENDLTAYRRSRLHWQDNRSLAAAAEFRGDVLLVEAERDAIVPHPVIENFANAFRQPRSLTVRVLRGADHALSEKRFVSDYNTVLVNWLTEMIVGSRLGDAASLVARHKQANPPPRRSGMG